MNRHGLVLTAVAAVVVIAGLFSLRPLAYDRIYSGVRVDGVEVGGRTREELAQLLMAWGREYRQRSLALYYGDTVFKLEAASLDYEPDVEATVEEVWGVGRQGRWWERLRGIRAAAREGADIPLKIRYNDNKLAALFEQWREQIDRPPRNAALSFAAGGIAPHEQGRRLEVEALKPMIIEALAKPEAGSLPLPVTPLYPEVTVNDIRQTGLKEFWATFATKFDAAEVNRSANIKLSARKVNGHILYPGQIFSFNQIVGPREKAHGFKEALEIMDGEFVPGVGGGVCQVSSTLYNAALLANLKIVERHNHSRPLGYVGLGRDATVAYDILDFRFANNTKSPIMIMAEIQGDRLLVGIVGQQPLAEKVEIATEKRVIPPAVVKKQDLSLYLGETKLERQGKPGYEVKAVRVVNADGREISRELLSKDRYLPEDTIVKVGARVPPFAGDKPARNKKRN